MKKDSYSYFLRVLTILTGIFLLAACNTDNKSTDSSSSASQSEMPVSEFFEKVEEANDSLESVTLKMTSRSEVDNEVSKQEMEADTAFATPGQETIAEINVELKDSSSDGETYQHDIMNDDIQDNFFRQTEEDGSWEYGTVTSEYDIDPNYFSLLEIFYSMADDLLLQETNDSYLLTLRSQNIDMVSLFEDEINMYIYGVSQSEVDKIFTITFDKESFYLTDFDIGISYHGDKGDFEALVSGSYSNWNEVKDSAFDAPIQVSAST